MRACVRINRKMVVALLSTEILRNTFLAFAKSMYYPTLLKRLVAHAVVQVVLWPLQKHFLFNTSLLSVLLLEKIYCTPQKTRINVILRKSFFYTYKKTLWQ